MLNYDILEMNVLEIDSIGGISKINLPFDITSIFCSDSTSTITTSLTQRYECHAQ